MTCKFKMFQLSGLVTMDHTSPDPFLDTSRARYKVIAPNQLFHHQDQAGALAAAMSSVGNANIVGHGEAGVISTGSGPVKKSTPATRIEVGNIGGWAPSTMTHLTLLGCNVGKGPEGATLLFSIAQATSVTVRAPVDYVYIGLDCEDYYLEVDTDWQTATPFVRPEPRFDVAPVLPPPFLLLRSGDRFVRLPTSAAQSVELYEPSLPDARSSLVSRWDGANTRVPIELVAFHEPLQRGAPAAIEKGQLVVSFGPTERDRRTFRIYNNNRLQDMTYPEVQYRASTASLWVVNR